MAVISPAENAELALTGQKHSGQMGSKTLRGYDGQAETYMGEYRGIS